MNNCNESNINNNLCKMEEPIFEHFIVVGLSPLSLSDSSTTKIIPGNIYEPQVLFQFPEDKP